MKSHMKRLISIWAMFLVILVFTSIYSYGQEGGESDLAKQAQNPIADLISLSLQNNTNFGVGPGDKTQNILNIQPIWPFSLNEDWNLITRTIIPVISQPGLVPGEGRTNGLGDITFTGFFSPAKPGTVIWGVGPVFLLPTATDDVLGSDKWGFEPSVVFLTMPGNWVMGSLFSNVWSFAGSGDQDVYLFTWQYFVNYNFPGQFSWRLVSDKFSDYYSQLGSRQREQMDGTVWGRIWKDISNWEAVHEYSASGFL